MSKSYGMVIDVARCTGCCNCFFACKDENCNEAHEGYTAAQPMTGQKWIDVKEIERGEFPKVNIRSVPLMCAHCDNPGCLKQARDGAVYKRDDGIVIIDPVKSKGQKDIVNTCPYRRIYWNDVLEIPQKCDMCAHLLDKGYASTRCAETCPTGAIEFGDFNDPESEVAKRLKLNPEALLPKFDMGERVLYLNYPKNFIAGSVVYTDEQGREMCCEGAKVTVEGADGTKLDLVSDNYGDFWAEGLATNVSFKVTVELAGHKTVVKDNVRTIRSINLGDIFMEKE